MSRKNTKGKPTRKELDTAIRTLAQNQQLMIEKIKFIENFIKSTDLALDLYIKFKGDDEAFRERIKEYNKEQEEAEKSKEKTEETVAKEEINS